jgi:hypothetical protein
MMMTSKEMAKWARDYPNVVLCEIPDDALILEVKLRQSRGTISPKDILLSQEVIQNETTEP